MYHKGQQSAGNQRKRNDMYVHLMIFVTELCCSLSLKSFPYSKKVVIRTEHYFKIQRAAINQRRLDTREYKADSEKLNHHQFPTWCYVNTSGSAYTNFRTLLRVHICLQLINHCFHFTLLLRWVVQRQDRANTFFWIAVIAYAEAMRDCSLVIVTFLWSVNPEMPVPQRRTWQHTHSNVISDTVVGLYSILKK